jgi:hypothetical protein
MKNQIRELIRGLSPKHILSNSPKIYVDDFIGAAIEVYDPATLQKALQHTFLYTVIITKVSIGVIF